MTTSPDKLIADLKASGSLKVWSLIITFFGDAVEPRGGIVAASTLQTVMEFMGVGSGAVRTACSRLAGDGWIERQKQGRNSFYRLSDMGHTPFRVASRQIYAAPVKPSQRESDRAQTFTLVMQNPLKANSAQWQAVRDSGTRINGNCVLFANDSEQLPKAITDTAEFDDMLVLSGANASFPDWLKRSVCADESAKRYHDLMHRFTPISQCKPEDPLTSLAIRCLLIHEWRRLLLRSTPVHTALTPADWPHDSCHAFVARLYQDIYNAGENWMDENALGPEGPLQRTKAESANRFTNDL
jgi:phenylacetic acid degradation operon negative regulatory protein